MDALMFPCTALTFGWPSFAVEGSTSTALTRNQEERSTSSVRLVPPAAATASGGLNVGLLLGLDARGEDERRAVPGTDHTDAALVEGRVLAGERGITRTVDGVHLEPHLAIVAGRHIDTELTRRTCTQGQIQEKGPDIEFVAVVCPVVMHDPDIVSAVMLGAVAVFGAVAAAYCRPPGAGGCRE